VQAGSRRASLLVFEVTTKTANEDREWMERRLDAVSDVQDRIDFVLIMTGHVSAKPCAVLDGDAAGVMMRSQKHVRAKGWSFRVGPAP